jgi:hypothetical protein
MTSFPITSRYYGISVAQFQTLSGRTVNYVGRRFIPASQTFELVAEHSVVSGDRLDNIAAQYLGDPEQFWRIAMRMAPCSPVN